MIRYVRMNTASAMGSMTSTYAIIGRDGDMGTGIPISWSPYLTSTPEPDPEPRVKHEKYPGDGNRHERRKEAARRRREAKRRR